ncbi:type I methionyl aminopeptidase [Candidatus Erwinia haradaeae]|uniref:Methionine aminopeptidase n=1 Tax=Candidatus Erwinia haradaeae TaxID=1922217 RepID=A0A803GCA1_9GAMM|nr:type I methionyl aminopeptidase [Candidatus Erwinia haradaeae]VFP87615.1 Methionine aminopeptidase [Candidatus Erwinia haradaeae]
MNIPIKTNEEIRKMRIAGSLAAEVLEMIQPYVIQDISTGELDSICHDYIVNKQHAIAACLGYCGFPKSVCISVNDVVCHGIPSSDKILQNGDIVNIDVTVLKDDYHADTSTMFIVGDSTTKAHHLCNITQTSLYHAIQLVRPGVRLQTLGHHIQKFVEKNGFSVVREYCGHGIGKSFHEAPQVLHYNANDRGVVLQPGMVFTIEPMVNVGSSRIRIMQDGWTVKTHDCSLSAQYEHTILVTQHGSEILTLRQNESVPLLEIND